MLIAPAGTAGGEVQDSTAALPEDGPGCRLGALSPREAEVAALVARGFTNRQIAEALVISPETAARHVQHILSKLGLHRRSQVAALVAAHAMAADEPPAAATSRSVSAPCQVAATTALKRGRHRAVVGLGLALLAALLLALSAGHAWVGGHAQAGGATPSHGEALFTLTAPNAEAQLAPPTMSAELALRTYDPRSSVSFTGEGPLFHAAAGYPMMVVRNVIVDDAVTEITARELNGAGGFDLQLGGCPGTEFDFYRLAVEPASGALSVSRVQCNTALLRTVLLPSARRLHPVEAGRDASVSLALHGQRLDVFGDGHLIASLVDSGPKLPPGTVRFAARSPSDVLLRALNIFRIA